MEVRIIIDTNKIHIVFFNPTSGVRNLYKYLFINTTTKIVLVYGGKLNKEYSNSNELLRMMKILDEAGKARKIDDNKVDSETEKIKKKNICLSNDPHIIALARLGKVRILCR